MSREQERVEQEIVNYLKSLASDTQCSKMATSKSHNSLQRMQTKAMDFVKTQIVPQMTFGSSHAQNDSPLERQRTQNPIKIQELINQRQGKISRFDSQIVTKKTANFSRGQSQNFDIRKSKTSGVKNLGRGMSLRPNSQYTSSQNKLSR